MYELLGRLAPPIRETILSPSFDHVVSIADVLAQVETMIDQAQSQHDLDLVLPVGHQIGRARPRQDPTAALPNEILILIGHLVLGVGHPGQETASSSWDRFEKTVDLHRFALTAVCRRWRAVFSLGEFWTDLRLGSKLLWQDRDRKRTTVENKRIGSRAGKKIDVFCRNGGLQTLDTTRLKSREELLPALGAMMGRSSKIKAWDLTLPGAIGFPKLWDVWIDEDEFSLERLSVGMSAKQELLWSMPTGLNVSSLVDLALDGVMINPATISANLPHLQSLNLSECVFLDPGGTLDSPKSIRFPRLRIFHINCQDDEMPWYREGALRFDLPNLEDLNYGDGGPGFFLPALLPPRPHVSAIKLTRLVIEYVETEDVLLDILYRHPSIVDLQLPELADRAQPFYRVVFSAIGAGCCPALRSLLVWHYREPNRLGTRAAIAMVQAREEAAARGHKVTPIREVHLEGDSEEFSKEENGWMRAHLVMYGQGYLPEE